ncbi:unnamed protein product [Porites lobata]|uniref:GST C-terminal domain-containing protein n=1 Tax=Porites lobata TaxID=104759 RepID=A0ABN8Q5T8_9CNID|nr:unnamed protein product [Porites lobata]
MPFIVTPEGKILAQSGTIMKYICKKGVYKSLFSSFFFSPLESFIHSRIHPSIHPSIKLPVRSFARSFIILPFSIFSLSFFLSFFLSLSLSLFSFLFFFFSYSLSLCLFFFFSFSQFYWVMPTRSLFCCYIFLLFLSCTVFSCLCKFNLYVMQNSGAPNDNFRENICLCPADSFDEATADMISDGVTDVFKQFSQILYEKDETKKEEIRKEFYGTTLPPRLEKFEALLKNRDEGKGFFLGEKLSHADISFFDLFNSFYSKGKEDVPGELEKFPLLVEHYKRVLNVPEINEWVKKRPASEF